MAAAELELLEPGDGWQVEGLGVVRGVDAVQKGDDVGVGITQADDLEDVAIDVADVKPILPHVRPPELPQLRAGALEEFQSLRPPDLRDFDVAPSSGFRLRRRASRQVAGWCQDR